MGGIWVEAGNGGATGPVLDTRRVRQSLGREGPSAKWRLIRRMLPGEKDGADAWPVRNAQR